MITDGRRSGLLLALPLIILLALPIVALLLAASPADWAAGVRDPRFAPALWLSLRTSGLALLLIVVSGTPLAWWLARSESRAARAMETIVNLPIVLPPAVVGLALLQAFGRGGPFGALFERLDVQVPFTTAAVVLAQVVVAAPFYVQAAASAFRRVDDDLLLVARTLGCTGPDAIRRVALPLARPGLVGGAALAWARALGEFGATLLFAGNLSGTTQTMPLAIYTALESDVRTAIALALALAGIAAVLLLALRRVRRGGGR